MSTEIIVSTSVSVRSCYFWNPFGPLPTGKIDKGQQ